MIEDADITVVVTLATSKNTLPPQFEGQIVLMDAEWQQIEKFAQECSDSTKPGWGLPEVTPTAPMYGIFTSGSTGRPKGIRNTHRATLNRYTICCYDSVYPHISRLNWMWEHFPYIGHSEVACHKTTLAFADHIAEIFGPLLQGVPVVVVDADSVIDIQKFIQLLEKFKVTRIILVPSLLKALMDNLDVGEKELDKEVQAGERVQDEKKTPKQRIPLPDLHHWVTSGEAISEQLVKKFHDTLGQNRTLLNLYGSTEVGADVTWCVLQRNDLPLIGRPLSNTQVYILDKSLQPVPVGVVGEIFVGGEPVCLGYLKNSALNSEKFLRNPFGPGRLFAMGDRARYLPDGNIEYRGRRDHMIKLRGFRVELGGIRAVVAQHTNIDDVVVSLKNDHVVAYVVPRDFNVTVEEYKMYVGRILPYYMVPDAFVRLKEIPLNQNGKVDHKKLPDPVRKGQ
jgi:non-ribosomal peptide synthetase component F